MDWMGNLVDNVQEDKSCNFDNRFHKIKVNENACEKVSFTHHNFFFGLRKLLFTVNTIIN